MTAVIAIPLRRGGEKETNPVKSPSGDHEVKKEGGEGQVVTTLVQILGSADPETAFLDAIANDVIPDKVCLELAERLGELARPALAGRGGVKAANFDNRTRIETVFALRESEAISEVTEQYLLLAILKMDEQEEVSAPAEIKLSIPEPTPESPAAAPQAPPVNSIANLIRSAAELQKQFGKNLPTDEQSEIRQAVGKLTEEEFASLRQILGSAILAEAEVPTGERQIDVIASLEVVEILLGLRQAELTGTAFLAYEVLTGEGFRLTHRNGHDRPLMTVSSITLLRNRFRRWLDSREFGPPNQSLRDATGQVGADELASAQKVVATLEGFLLAAADDYTRATVQRDNAARLRERIISSWVRILDAVNEELVAAQPVTKEEALRQVQGYLHAKRCELASELRAAGSAILGEAETAIWRIFDLHSACSALRREVAELEINGYDPAAQRPVLSDHEKQAAYFEIKRKEDEFSLREIESQIEAGIQAGSLAGKRLKKARAQRDEALAELEGLDWLIAGLRQATDPVKLATPVTGQGVRHG